MASGKPVGASVAHENPRGVVYDEAVYKVIVAVVEAYADIAKTGVCSVDKVEQNHGIEDRTALNTLDVFYTGMGIKTDIVTPDYLLVSTAKRGGASDDN